MKKALVVLVFISISLFSRSNEKGKIKIDFDLYNRHYWRGFLMGNAPVVEPAVTYSNKGFSFNAWAAHAFNGSYSEIDLIPSYTHKNFTFTLFDYYNPIAGAENKYFSFSEGKSRHSLELAVNYQGEGKIPLKIMAGSFIFGDKNPATNQPFYSTYIELGYPFKIKKVDTEIHAGITPFKGYYAENTAFISTGITFRKRITLSETLSVPLKFAVQMNPYTSKAFIIFGAGISKN